MLQLRLYRRAEPCLLRLFISCFVLYYYVSVLRNRCYKNMDSPLSFAAFLLFWKLPLVYYILPLTWSRNPVVSGFLFS